DFRVAPIAPTPEISFGSPIYRKTELSYGRPVHSPLVLDRLAREVRRAVESPAPGRPGCPAPHTSYFLRTFSLLRPVASPASNKTPFSNLYTIDFLSPGGNEVVVAYPGYRTVPWCR